MFEYLIKTTSIYPHISELPSLLDECGVRSVQELPTEGLDNCLEKFIAFTELESGLEDMET